MTQAERKVERQLRLASPKTTAFLRVVRTEERRADEARREAERRAR